MDTTAHITAAKIVSSPTDSSWAQAYTAGKLSIVLSIVGTPTEPIASLGKDTLEKLQREFFALDEKNLNHIKKAAHEVVTTIPPELTISLVLSTTVENILYVVVANEGFVLLKRGEEAGIIAIGKKNDVTGFSGMLKPEDCLLLGTGNFYKTVSYARISKALLEKDHHKIAENLAPFLHDEATGAEAALVYTLPAAKISSQAETTPDELPKEEEFAQNSRSTHLPDTSIFTSFLSKVDISFIKRLSRKQMTFIAVIILLCVLGGSILAEKMKRDDVSRQTQMEAFLPESKARYEDAVAVMSLNKSLAVEELTEVKNKIEEKLTDFPKTSSQRRDLSLFLDQVNKALAGEGITTNSVIKVFYDGTKSEEITEPKLITTKGESLIIFGNKKIGVMSADGTVKDTFEVDLSSVKGLTADSKNAYILQGDNVSQIVKSTGKLSTIIDAQENPVSIDTFGGNIYLLSKGEKNVYKFRPNEFAKEAYFTKDVTLESPTSLTIDASVYVLDNAKIRKFTRGAEDSFSTDAKSFSSSSKIFTNEDYANLYLLDPSLKTVSIIEKSGAVKQEFSLKGMKNITGMAADEKNKKIYVAADSKIYSIEF